MADTTPDTSNKDQMSIVVRYVADNKPVERLLSLTVLGDKSGDGHATEILRCLNKHSVDMGSEALTKAQETVEGALKLRNLS